jgi:ubiquitin-protein ligase
MAKIWLFCPCDDDEIFSYVYFIRPQKYLQVLSSHYHCPILTKTEMCTQILVKLPVSNVMIICSAILELLHSDRQMDGWMDGWRDIAKLKDSLLRSFYKCAINRQ